jgi:hypothetical protein
LYSSSEKKSAAKAPNRQENAEIYFFLIELMRSNATRWSRDDCRDPVIVILLLLSWRLRVLAAHFLPIPYNSRDVMWDVV